MLLFCGFLNCSTAKRTTPQHLRIEEDAMEKRDVFNRMIAEVAHPDMEAEEIIRRALQSMVRV